MLKKKKSKSKIKSCKTLDTVLKGIYTLSCQSKPEFLSSV